MVQVMKEWKHYLMGKEIVIHTNHQSLQYLQTQNKLQQTKHYKWMGFLQQFHLVINYKKGNTNNLSIMIPRPHASKIIDLGTLMHMDPFTHDAYREAHSEDEDFKEVHQ